MRLFSKWIGPRTRVNYWSCSNFADWVRRTFGGMPKPGAESMEGWVQWKLEARKKSTFIFWFTEEFLDDLQDWIFLPVDLLNALRYYVKNRFFDKLHYLPTGLKPGSYYDLDTRLLHGLFEALVDFIEIEKAHMQFWTEGSKAKRPWRYAHWLFRWKAVRDAEAGLKYVQWESTLDKEQPEEYFSCDSQAHAAREQLALYDWWKNVRPNRPDPMDASGWSEYCEKRREENGGELSLSGKLSDEGKTALEKTNEIEDAYYKEDEEMMIRLIKIRGHLWT